MVFCQNIKSPKVVKEWPTKKNLHIHRIQRQVDDWVRFFLFRNIQFFFVFFRLSQKPEISSSFFPYLSAAEQQQQRKKTESTYLCELCISFEFEFGERPVEEGKIENKERKKDEVSQRDKSDFTIFQMAKFEIFYY